MPGSDPTRPTARAKGPVRARARVGWRYAPSAGASPRPLHERIHRHRRGRRHRDRRRPRHRAPAPALALAGRPPARTRPGATPPPPRRGTLARGEPARRRRSLPRSGARAPRCAGRFARAPQRRRHGTRTGRRARPSRAPRRSLLERMPHRGGLQRHGRVPHWRARAGAQPRRAESPVPDQRDTFGPQARALYALPLLVGGEPAGAFNLFFEQEHEVSRRTQSSSPRWRSCAGRRSSARCSPTPRRTRASRPRRPRAMPPASTRSACGSQAPSRRSTSRRPSCARRSPGTVRRPPRSA